jgi:acyl-CoA reductase-like NAD-dependent aldehyde dehydrogenase
MISDATVDRYYYIFDSRERRPLVMDRQTGAEVDWDAAPRVQLIDYVAAARSTVVLRRFARWCARQTNVDTVPSDTPTGRLWTAAQEGEEAWPRVRAETVDAVVEAVVLDLSRHRADAARLLVAHACTHPDPRQAAIDAAHMSERAAEFAADAAPTEAVRALRQRQIDWLLDEVGKV